VFGVLLYLLLFPLLLRLHDRGPRIRDALLGIVFCTCLIGWATDVLEVPTATLFLGMAIAHVLTPRDLPRQRPYKRIETPHPHRGVEPHAQLPRDALP